MLLFLTMPSTVASGLTIALLALVPTVVRASAADVVAASARCAATTCAVSATVRHADEGWQHYADRWEVLTTDGRILGTRILQHPHVDEQPVTRALEGVAIPMSVQRVRIRAHDSVHGFGGKEIEIPVERTAPP